MKKKSIIVIGSVAVLLLGIFVGYKTLSQPQKTASVLVEEIPPVELESLAPSVLVNVTKSKTKDNTLILSISGLQSKYETVAYELSYDSMGVVQGVTTKPLDIAGKDTFLRDDIYMGTCSRNVCRPHQGVKKVSLALEFINTSGKKSQFTKDFDL